MRSTWVAEILFLIILFAVIVVCARIARTRRMPRGGPGATLPVALGVWWIGHVVESFWMLEHPEPTQLSPSDPIFVGAAFALSLTAYQLWSRAGTYLDPGALLRTGMDTLLIALAVVLVYWHVVVPLVQHSPLRPATLWLVMGYVFGGGVIAGSQITRFWQRREPGSGLLAIACVIMAGGVMIWCFAKLGVDRRWIGLTMMSIGALILPLAVFHPANARQIVFAEPAQRDRMGALAFHLLMWAATFIYLLGHPMDVMTVVLAFVCIVIIYLRVSVVRTSELRLLDRLHTLAFTDPLTGIGNRRSLLSHLTDLPNGWLITIDLDGFKQINDQYGHEAGDEVLRRFVQRVGAILPREIHFARIGGDEFAIVVPEGSLRADRLGERILIEARDPHYARLTASVGLTRHEPDADPGKTMRDSDIAMQEAKRAGKDQLASLTESMVAARLRDLDLAARLSESIDHVYVVYQPIVALSPGYPVIAVEALARWTDPELGPVSPAEFIPVAEQQGLIRRLGTVVLNQAIDQLREWLAAGEPRQVSVNVSWLQLRDPVTVEALARRIGGHPDLARWLILEVTETVFAEDEAAVAAIGVLRRLGVTIAIDDFGTGASNLHRLRTVPADMLKIDKSLLEGLGTHPEAEAMVATVVRLGEGLGMTVVAEGVEDAVTTRMLAELGVVAAQGFHFARPGAPLDVPCPVPLMRPWLGRRQWVRSAV
ncbi:MAG: putative bifunctional diguanylate cyclase/phosphodiesterase [Actinomycetales bacterium]